MVARRRTLFGLAVAALSLSSAGGFASDILDTEPECLAGGPSARACEEDEVELVEEQLGELTSVALLQVGQRHIQASRDPAKPSGSSAAAAEAQDVDDDDDSDVQGDTPEVNCSQYWMFCDPKVNCSGDPLTAADRKALNGKLATTDGHANLRSWCLAYPLYSNSLQKCVLENDPVGYANATYAAQREAKLEAADAVYCFMAGHCNNTEVTVNTTLQEAEKICDTRYGHERWTGIGWHDFMSVLARAKDTMEEGTKALRENRTTWADLVKVARHEAEISAMTACAMGNYHCDVFYCRQNYCHNKMYSSFANFFAAA